MRRVLAGTSRMRTSREIERMWLAQQSMAISRMNLYALVLLCALLLTLMVTLVLSSSPLYDLAGQWWSLLSEIVGLKPAGQHAPAHLADVLNASGVRLV